MHYICSPNAEVAQLVEHNLAKVGVASSSLVFRSMSLQRRLFLFEIKSILLCPDGEIGRHAGLKILWPVMAVWVQVPLRVPFLYYLTYFTFLLHNTLNLGKLHKKLLFRIFRIKFVLHLKEKVISLIESQQVIVPTISHKVLITDFKNQIVF
jgi:hypothetical protein